jgi:NitT/TauT family transport system permease protein
MKNRKIWRFFIAALFWLGMWQLLAQRLELPLLLPYPAAVARRLIELMATADFWRTALSSLGRVFAAFLLGAAAGSLCAVLCAVSPLCSAILSPMMHVIRATPVASFIILLLLWLPGAGWVSLAAAMLMTAPIFWANLGRAIEETDPKLLEMARAYALGRWKTLRHVYLPGMRAALAAACESGVGLAWKAGVAAEVLTRPKIAIGRMVYETKLYLETTDLFAWTAVVVLLSRAVERLVRALVRKGAGA